MFDLLLTAIIKLYPTCKMNKGTFYWLMSLHWLGDLIKYTVLSACCNVANNLEKDMQRQSCRINISQIWQNSRFIHCKLQHRNIRHHSDTEQWITCPLIIMHNYIEIWEWISYNDIILLWVHWAMFSFTSCEIF